MNGYYWLPVSVESLLTPLQPALAEPSAASGTRAFADDITAWLWCAW